ncbi:MAG TPA: SRPBCC domain-containing protein [Armatimonadota bacterium]|jgi:uncharacterized protein YndB with AHSA1/START domain
MAAQPYLDRFDEIVLETRIALPKERVWELMVDRISDWWTPDILVNNSARAMVLEPFVGGRLFEDWGDGGGLLWATVTTLKKPERLELTGCIAAAGAVLGVVDFRFDDDAGGTLLKMSHRAIGELTAADREEFAGGWQEVIGVVFKGFAEGQ